MSMKYLFLSVFVIASIIHLYASHKSNSKLRAQSKGFLLLSLLGWYCCAASCVQPIVIAAILTSWLGDVLLIPKGVKWFALGGISFAVSHFFFALTYCQNVDFAALPIWAVVLIAAFYIIAVLLVFRGLGDCLPEKLYYPMFGYLLINGAMNCFALFQLLTVPCAATVITFVGAVLFFASDSALFYTRFKKDSVFKNHFFVMLSYIIGEFLIVLGIVML